MKQYRPFLIVSCVFAVIACNSKHTLFEKISSSKSGISFENKITENDSINPLDIVNIYNGGGVGIGDFNNDGKQDIFFSGNMVPCKLYINKGNFQFEDVTDKAGVDGMGRWARGVSIVDINNDGLMDIYICNTIYKDSLRRRNILYVNQGVDKDGVPHFKDMAAEYGLDIHVQSTMASFFDYDNDGDLDMYLTVNEASNGYSSSIFRERHQVGSGAANRGRLYRCDWDSVLNHPVYHDVSEQAGIKFDGYGHAATICDINNDGWKDIYVTDDFLSNNILYVNNHDGTFTNRVKDYFRHTSFNAMGQEVTDINNDGLADVIELDMNPPDNFRKKMMLSSSNYITYQNFDMYGYQYQYVRNTLELNQGRSLGENDSIGIPVFSDIGFLSGIAQTDWSWDPIVTDFDNDGYRDIIITNGFPRDVSDHDFISYRQTSKGSTNKAELLKLIPEVKLHNYAYHNNGNLTFSDETNNWGFPEPTFSSGGAYVDLDGDGAMDLVISNINDEASVFRNTRRDKDTGNSNFLQVKFNGGKQNINGLGAVARIYYDHNKQQMFENNPYRGYLSTIQGIAHFGLGATTMVDSVVVRWNNQKKQVIKNVKANQVITADINAADMQDMNVLPTFDTTALFTNITKASGITYEHKDFVFIDFSIQSVLPHKFTEYAPALAVGDVDGNGLEDIVTGGDAVHPAQILLQQGNGSFTQKAVYASQYLQMKSFKDEGILLFDANGDGKLDLYMSSGGFQQNAGSENYQDRLYINDGKGDFTLDSAALPQNHTSKLCVRAMDYNHDGKLDLFVSGRVDPWHYPRPVSSFIFRNDSKDGHAKFTDVTNEVAPELKNIGMVCDALFTDFDGDGNQDLVLTGEWMPITFLKNENGKFKNVTPATGIADKKGWWNSIVAGDFRHTGRMDYIVGNVGTNTFFQASDQYPVRVTAADFANNGGFVSVPSLYLPDKNGELKEFPAYGRDDVLERLPAMKKQFLSYSSFANATMDDIFPADKRKNAIRVEANMLSSVYLRNEGNGKFTMIPLPLLAQTSTLNGMVVDDFDQDGNLDVAISGNDYGTDVSIGRYDAFNGLILKGDGEGGFTPLSIEQGGLYIPGDGKGLVKLSNNKNGYMLAASQYDQPLKLFKLRYKGRTMPIEPNDISATIYFQNGKKQKVEFYYGSSFLSQSGRFLELSQNIKEVELLKSDGTTRKIGSLELNKFF